MVVAKAWEDWVVWLLIWRYGCGAGSGWVAWWVVADVRGEGRRVKGEGSRTVRRVLFPYCNVVDTQNLGL